MNQDEISQLEALGEEAVLVQIARGGYGAAGSSKRSEVEAWLRSKSVLAAAESSAKRDAREARMLEIAEEANRIATRALFNSDRANVNSTIAMILSAATAIAVAVISFMISK